MLTRKNSPSTDNNQSTSIIARKPFSLPVRFAVARTPDLPQILDR